MKIQLKKVRISYANIFDAKAFQDGPAKFSATYLFAKDHPCVATIKNAIAEVAKEKWGAKADAVLKTINAAGKGLLHDGERINASLAGIQFHSHGAAFGASDSTPDEFESVEDEEESLI